MEIERQRGISVATSVIAFTYKNKKINILDTPGHKDFAEDTFRTLTAVDSVIVVIDVSKGVEEQTEKLVEVCRMRNIPIIVFINKLDREGKDAFDLLDEVEKKLGEGTKPINTNDGPISRVDHKWQQEKGSNISNDGFFKEGFDTVTLPKSIDTDTPEGNKAAGKIVDQLKDAKKRGEKMKVEQQNSDWENRKPQIIVKKEEG